MQDIILMSVKHFECAGISMYNAPLGVRQACILAKTIGDGRVSFYLTPEKRHNLAAQSMLEIQKPPIDLSGSRQGADLNFEYRNAIKYKNEKLALVSALEYELESMIFDILVSRRDLKDNSGHKEIAKILILLSVMRVCECLRYVFE